MPEKNIIPYNVAQRWLKRTFYSLIFVAAQFFLTAGILSAQEAASVPDDNPRLEISGTIHETTDYFGRKRFIGKVINMEKKRIDFIKIGFTLRDREGNILEMTESYINGQRHRFRDRQVSTSSLAPGTTGTFDIIVSTPAEKVFSYSHTITGMNFVYP